MDKSDLLKLLSQDTKARKFALGELIVQEGSPAHEGLAFMLSGEAKVIQTQGDKRVLLGFIKAGQFFGETALVLARPRMASVVAASPDTIVMFMGAQQFKAQISKNYLFLDMLMNHSIARVEYVMAALSRLKIKQELMVDPSLANLIQENRLHNLKLQEMLNHTRSTWVGSGKSLFLQNDRHDGQTYLVVKGTLAAVRTEEKQHYKIFNLMEGDIFGYNIKSSGSVRRYSVYAEGESARIISLDEELLGKIMRINHESFFYYFRSIITQLVILDDALRVTSSKLMTTVGDAKTEAEIMGSLGRAPEKLVAAPEEPEDFLPEPGALADEAGLQAEELELPPTV